MIGCNLYSIANFSIFRFSYLVYGYSQKMRWTGYPAMTLKPAIWYPAGYLNSHLVGLQFWASRIPVSLDIRLAGYWVLYPDVYLIYRKGRISGYPWTESSIFSSCCSVKYIAIFRLDRRCTSSWPNSSLWTRKRLPHHEKKNENKI